ncbi:IS5/IS1182 family transposase, partial [Klenkia sp. LSe6-5]
MCVCTCKPAYSSSLTDAEWALVASLLPAHDP